MINRVKEFDETLFKSFFLTPFYNFDIDSGIQVFQILRDSSKLSL